MDGRKYSAKRWTKLAQGDHSYVATRQERERSETTWVFRQPSEGAEEPFQLAFIDFFDPRHCFLQITRTGTYLSVEIRLPITKRRWRREISQTADYQDCLCAPRPSPSEERLPPSAVAIPRSATFLQIFRGWSELLVPYSSHLLHATGFSVRIGFRPMRIQTCFLTLLRLEVLCPPLKIVVNCSNSVLKKCRGSGGDAEWKISEKTDC